MDENDIRRALKAACAKTGSAEEWARRNDMKSAQYVRDVMNGHREPGPKIYGALGLKRVVEYAPIRPQPPSPSDVDPADPENLKNARREFERALDGKGSLMDWARKWGGALIGLADQLEIAKECIINAENDATGAEEALERAKERMEDAALQVERLDIPPAKLDPILDMLNTDAL